MAREGDFAYNSIIQATASDKGKNKNVCGPKRPMLDSSDSDYVNCKLCRGRIKRYYLKRNLKLCSEEMVPREDYFKFQLFLKLQRRDLGQDEEQIRGRNLATSGIERFWSTFVGI